MNIFIQCCVLVVFFVLLEEFIEIGEAYKVIRPYKYYQRRPWHRPRWHTGQRSPKFYRSKGIPSKDGPFHRPGYARYRPFNEDFADQSTDDQPYTIVIQLPKRDGKYNRRPYQRNYESDPIPVYMTEGDYIEDEEDIDAKMLNVDDKKVRIKVTKGESPKLHIKISRIDAGNDIEIIDKSNMTDMNIPLQPKVYTNLTVSMQPSEGDWTSSDAHMPRIEDLQRK